MIPQLGLCETTKKNQKQPKPNFKSNREKIK